MQPTVWAVNLKMDQLLFFAKNGDFTMAAKKKIINIRVYFDGDQDAKEVFAEVIAQKIRDTKTKDKLAIMKDRQYNDYEFSNLKSAQDVQRNGGIR